MSQGIVVGLASVRGAGKSGIADQFVDHHGFELFHVGDAMRQAAIEHSFVPADKTREAFRPLWEMQAREHGQDWLAQTAIRQADEHGQRVLMDGVRLPADAETVANTGLARMVWVEADLPTAAQRAFDRGKSEDSHLTTVDDYLAEMQANLDNTGPFLLGQIRDLCNHSVGPIPEIPDLGERLDYYSQLSLDILTEAGIN